jgi:hypothetical protein
MRKFYLSGLLLAGLLVTGCMGSSDSTTTTDRIPEVPPSPSRSAPAADSNTPKPPK